MKVGGKTRLYVQGQGMDLAPEDEWFARFFCNQMTLLFQDFEARSPSPAAASMLYQLYAQGAADFYDPV